MFNSISNSLGKAYNYTHNLYPSSSNTQDVMKVLSWQVSNWQEDDWYKELLDPIEVTISSKVDQLPVENRYRKKDCSKKDLTNKALTDMLNEVQASTYNKECRLEFSFSHEDKASHVINKVSFFVCCGGKPNTHNVVYGKVLRVIKFSTLAPDGYVDKEDVHYLHPVIIPE